MFGARNQVIDQHQADIVGERLAKDLAMDFRNGVFGSISVRTFNGMDCNKGDRFDDANDILNNAKVYDKTYSEIIGPCKRLSTQMATSLKNAAEIGIKFDSDSGKTASLRCVKDVEKIARKAGWELTDVNVPEEGIAKIKDAIELKIQEVQSDSEFAQKFLKEYGEGKSLILRENKININKICWLKFLKANGSPYRETEFDEVQRLYDDWEKKADPLIREACSSLDSLISNEDLNQLCDSLLEK
ncbi:MAG: hypothetical protein LBP31_01275 [Holosporales bacterium]|nr:hypothetical protein [Holosporales bacterium]